MAQQTAQTALANLAAGKSATTERVITANDVVEMAQALEMHRQSAIEQLLVEAGRVQESLKLLGYEGDIFTSVTPVVARKRAPNVPRANGGHCPICNIDGHDGRAHRSQQVKRKFTPTELAQLARKGA